MLAAQLLHDLRREDAGCKGSPKKKQKHTIKKKKNNNIYNDFYTGNL